MPERSCQGCTKQKEWGCTASKSEVPPGTKGAVPSMNGKTWWLWENPARLPLVFDGERTFACPRQHLKANARGWHKVFLYYGFYKSGFLPQAGAVLDQSNKAMELFRIIDAANAEADESLMEARQKGPQDKPRKGPQRR